MGESQEDALDVSGGDNIKIVLTGMEWGCMDCINVAHNSDQW
jgi:hypothetical protein